MNYIALINIMSVNMRNLLILHTTLPIDICNIILQYTIIHIEQIGDNKVIQYKYNDKIYSADIHTLGVIDNCVYVFTLAANNKYLYIYNIDQDELIKVPSIIPAEIYIMKYSNGLVCEHFNNIAIYNATILNDTIVFKERRSKYTVGSLLYANDRHIITRCRYDDGMMVYDTNLVFKYMIETNDYVRYVALVNNVLSYYTHDWHAIEQLI